MELKDIIGDIVCLIHGFLSFNLVIMMRCFILYDDPNKNKGKKRKGTQPEFLVSFTAGPT